MARVVVTGGAGFVGSYVVRALVELGHDVAVYDNFAAYTLPTFQSAPLDLASRIRPISEKIKVVRVSMTQRDLLRLNLSSFEPDVVIHMAAMPFTGISLDLTEEALTSIVNSTQNLLDIIAAGRWRCRLVFISSSMVYGNFLSTAISEDHPKQPTTLYGALKLSAELIVRAYERTWDLDVVIIRPAAVYGPLAINNTIIQRWIRSAMAGETLQVHGDGSLEIDFTYVLDAADGILAAALHPAAKGMEFNITRGQARSLNELLDILRLHFPRLKSQNGPRPSNVPNRGTLSIERASRLIGFRPQIPLEEGVRRYIEHLRSNDY